MSGLCVCVCVDTVCVHVTSCMTLEERVNLGYILFYIQTFVLQQKLKLSPCIDIKYICPSTSVPLPASEASFYQPLNESTEDIRMIRCSLKHVGRRIVKVTNMGFRFVWLCMQFWFYVR